MNRKVKKKGITPIVAIVILLLIAVAIAGSAYTWIGGYYTGLTGNAISITDTTCSIVVGDDDVITIRFTNIGTEPLTLSNANMVDRVVFGEATPATTANYAYDTVVNPGTGGTVTDTQVETAAFTSGATYRYFIEVGGRTTQTQVTC